MMHEPDRDQPCYVISVAAKLVDLHPQTLRNYERLGLVKPRRSAGRVRLYSPQDIDRLQRIARLTDELGVNLAGAEIILGLTDRLRRMREEMQQLERDFHEEVRRLQEALAQREPAQKGFRGEEEKERT